MTEQNPIISRYIAQFRSGLKNLPETERTEIVQEIESHIAEAINGGRSVAEVLERLGPADRLARAYVADALVGSGRGHVRNWFRAAGVLMLSSLTSLFVFPILGVFTVVMPVAGATSLVGNIIYYFYPVNWIPHTSIPMIQSPELLLAVGEVACVIILAIGIVSFVLLKGYVKLLTRTLRSAMN